MSSKSMIIIGAGLAGLATGCYARMNGYETEIFEQHTAPGGVCTAWERSELIDMNDIIQELAQLQIPELTQDA